MSSDNPVLYVLTGPTASGKSRLGLRFAQQHELEILCADSMSIYRHMDIGTAKPGPADRQKVRHHGLDLVDPWEDFDTARFVAMADACICDATKRGKKILVIGGTPLYLRALLSGFFAGPSADPPLRARLAAREREEKGVLHEELSRVDREAAGRIHKNDLKRLVRALEVHELTGSPISTLQKQFGTSETRYAYRAVWLDLPRDVLRARVRARSRDMFERGLLDEVKGILAKGGFSKSAGSAIGYQEILRFLGAELKAEELEYRIRSNTHRLLRRQECWFRRFEGLVKLKIMDLDEDAILERIAELFFGTKDKE